MHTRKAWHNGRTILPPGFLNINAQYCMYGKALKGDDIDGCFFILVFTFYIKVFNAFASVRSLSNMASCVNGPVVSEIGGEAKNCSPRQSCYGNTPARGGLN